MPEVSQSGTEPEETLLGLGLCCNHLPGVVKFATTRVSIGRAFALSNPVRDLIIYRLNPKQASSLLSFPLG